MHTCHFTKRSVQRCTALEMRQIPKVTSAKGNGSQCVRGEKLCYVSQFKVTFQSRTPCCMLIQRVHVLQKKPQPAMPATLLPQFLLPWLPCDTQRSGHTKFHQLIALSRPVFPHPSSHTFRHASFSTEVHGGACCLGSFSLSLSNLRAKYLEGTSRSGMTASQQRQA